MRRAHSLSFFNWLLGRKAVFAFLLAGCASVLTAPFLNGASDQRSDRLQSREKASRSDDPLFSCAELVDVSQGAYRSVKPLPYAAAQEFAAPPPAPAGFAGFAGWPFAALPLPAASVLCRALGMAWPAAAAASSCPPMEFDKTAPLHITWDTGAGPLAIGWRGESPCMILPESAGSFVITRELYRQGQVYELLAIPRDPSLRPSVFAINENDRAVHISKPPKIPPHEYWIWGGTLDSPCEKPCLPGDYLPDAALVFRSPDSGREAGSALSEHVRENMPKGPLSALPLADLPAAPQGAAFHLARGFFAFKLEKRGYIKFESPYLEAAAVEGMLPPPPSMRRRCLQAREEACRASEKQEIIEPPSRRGAKITKSGLSSCLQRSRKFCAVGIFAAPYSGSGFYGRSHEARFQFDPSPRPCPF